MLTVEFATAVVLVVAAVPELFEEVVGELPKFGTSPQPAIVKVEHSLANKFLIRPNSL